MSTDKKQSEKIVRFDSYKLKDRLDFPGNISDSITKNPFDKLSFEDEEIFEIKKQKPLSLIKTRLLLFAFIVILSSFLLNPFLAKTIDPLIFKTISMPFTAIETFYFDQITKPYVLTVGEYGNLSIAKSEAVKLLPILKQVNIKELSSGIYTFEIERYSSKKKAYKALSKLEQGGFEVVHVRYLKD